MFSSLLKPAKSAVLHSVAPHRPPRTPHTPAPQVPCNSPSHALILRPDRLPAYQNIARPRQPASVGQRQFMLNPPARAKSSFDRLKYASIHYIKSVFPILITRQLRRASQWRPRPANAKLSKRVFTTFHPPARAGSARRSAEYKSIDHSNMHSSLQSTSWVNQLSIPPARAGPCSRRPASTPAPNANA